MKSYSWIAPVLVAWFCTLGCDRGVIAPMPTPITSTVPGTSPPPEPATTARLAVSDFTVTVHPGYSAEARFTLTEIGGVSGATIDTVAVFNSQENDITGQSCWRNPIHVEAGGTLDIFNARYGSLSYCAPYFDGPISDSVSLTVGFIDDHGVTGTVNATTRTIIR